MADQVGHARVSITQDVYVGRRLASRQAAEALEQAFSDPEDEKYGNSADRHLHEAPHMCTDLRRWFPRLDSNQ